MPISKYIIVVGDKVATSANTPVDAERKAKDMAEFTQRKAFLFCGLEVYSPHMNEIDNRLESNGLTATEARELMPKKRGIVSDGTTIREYEKNTEETDATHKTE